MTDVEHQAPVGLLAEACALTRQVLENVDRDQLGLPTPCADWTVHELVNHIVGAVDFFADLAESGACAPDRDWPDYAAGRFTELFGHQAGRLIRGFSQPGALEKTMELPTGPGPGSQCIEVATGEIFVHGWDLARATGQPMPGATEVASELLASGWPSLSDQVRQQDRGRFAVAVAVAASAPADDQLVGFLGRDPSWRAS